MLNISENLLLGSLQHFQSELVNSKPVFGKIVPMQALTQSTNNVFQSILKSTDDKEAIDTSDLSRRMQFLNDKFAETLQKIRDFEAR